MTMVMGRRVARGRGQRPEWYWGWLGESGQPTAVICAAPIVAFTKPRGRYGPGDACMGGSLCGGTREVKRISRLLQMVCLLQQGEGWNAPALADRFGISRTRIFEDISALREAGVPVVTTRAGYRIAPSFFLPSVGFTPDELLACLFPIQHLTDGKASELSRRSAESKLVSCLPAESREVAQELLRRSSVVIPHTDVPHDVFSRIREAVAKRLRLVLFIPRPSPSQLRRVEFDPYGLAYRGLSWYVVGYSVTEGSMRRFVVSDIRAVERVGLRFTVPEGFSVAAWFEEAEVGDTERLTQVALRFTPRVDRCMMEHPPQPGLTLQTFSDGSTLYRASVADLDDTARWLMQFGANVRVLHPRELVDKAIALATGILKNHRASLVARSGDGDEQLAGLPWRRPPS